MRIPVIQLPKGADFPALEGVMVTPLDDGRVRVIVRVPFQGYDIQIRATVPAGKTDEDQVPADVFIFKDGLEVEG